MNERDYYEVLGLSHDADGITVNRTYWQLARKFQDLATTDPRARHMLDELNEAYGVLGTPALRDAYDACRVPSTALRDKRETEPTTTAIASWTTPKQQTAQTPTARPERLSAAWLGYGGGAALSVIALGTGLWTNSIVLDLLAGSGLASVGGAAAWNAVRQRGARHGERVVAPAVATAAARRPSVTEPLTASIVPRRGASVDDLRSSTASMVDRWRAKASDGAPTVEPDHTLVDIFRSEQEIETHSEPLTAVLDVLRGSRSPVSR